MVLTQLLTPPQAEPKYKSKILLSSGRKSTEGLAEFKNGFTVPGVGQGKVGQVNGASLHTLFLGFVGQIDKMTA